jgi:glucose 1-dehydrogenase
VVPVRALAVTPLQANTARLEEMPEPDPSEGSLLVETLFVGVCGTDLEIAAGDYGWAPPGSEFLVLGHESLGRVAEPAGDFAEGDLVVGIVRQPDPEPCAPCAAGEWDMCRNGRYTEHGIKELHGFCRERYRIAPEFAVKLDPSLDRVGVLLEPTTVVAKAWDHVERIGHRATWEPRKALVTGAGPIGLLAALLGVQRGLDVHVLDRHTDGPKPQLLKDLGATYHVGSVEEACKDADVVIEATGVGQLVFDVMQHTAPSGVVCLTGVSPAGRQIDVDAGLLNRTMVLENDVVFGSVNANRRHYEQGAEALAKADRDWLERLVTRTVPLDQFQSGLQREEDDVKVVIDVRS